MDKLTWQTEEAVVDAVVALGLTTPAARTQLMRDLPPMFALSLPTLAEPMMQLLSDLTHLQQVPRLTDSPTPPVVRWLRRAHKLAALRAREQAVIGRALTELGHPIESPEGDDGLESPPPDHADDPPEAALASTTPPPVTPPSDPPSKPPALEILYYCVHAPDIDDLDLDSFRAEIATIEHSLESPIRQGAARFRPSFGSTLEELLGQLELHSPRVLHLAGHGNTDGTLTFWTRYGGSTVDGEMLADMIGYSDSVRVVVLAGCRYGKQVEPLLEVVDAVVSTGAAIDDKVCAEFGGAFHMALARGDTIDKAFKRGLLMARAQNRAQARHLRLHPGARLEPDELKRLTLVDPSAEVTPGPTSPELYIVAGDSEFEQTVVRDLIAQLPPDVRANQSHGHLPGTSLAETLSDALGDATVIAVLFDPQSSSDIVVQDQVARAVHIRRATGCRIVPVYISGTKPHPKVQFGLADTVPLYIRGPSGRARAARTLADLVRLERDRRNPGSA